MKTVIAYDIGTTGIKTCFYEIKPNFKSSHENPLTMVDYDSMGYSLTTLSNGGVEQDPEEWWESLVLTTKNLSKRNPEAISSVSGISFCSQMQSVVLLDKSGRHLRPSMSYMDQRSGSVKDQTSGRGPKVAGVGLPFLLKSLYHTGVVSASDKDPVWKYLWVKENEPDVFARVHKWVDVKEALIARMTGKFVMSRDSAFATLLCDKNLEYPTYSLPIMKTLGVNPDHMPEIVLSTQCVGTLLPEIADEMGLPKDTQVFAGGGDASLIGIGAGCSQVGDTHIYMGTSGWASVITDKQLVDTKAMIASVVGVQPGYYNYFAELETAGKCLEWVKDHLALDEINIYMTKTDITASEESTYTDLYDYLSSVISGAEPGCNGVLFAPWLHGNRCPFEDANARGLFIGIGIETGKTEMLRSVIEGICYHMRWFLETIAKKVTPDSTVRFVGGGALSPVTASILADILGRPVETVKDPQNIGAFGAAMLTLAGLGYIDDLRNVKDLIPANHIYKPNLKYKDVYERNYKGYKELHHANKKIFAILNEEVIHE